MARSAVTRTLAAGVAIAWLGIAASAPLSAASLTVAGRVLDVELRPVAGAHVELSPAWSGGEAPAAGAPPPIVATTDGAGRFALAAPETGVWRLSLQAPGRVPVERVLEPLVESVRLPPAILPRDRGLKVRVLDAAGELAPAAQVWAEPDSAGALDFGWHLAPRRGVTDREGAVVLPRADDEVLRVKAFLAAGAAATDVARTADLLLRATPTPATDLGPSSATGSGSGPAMPTSPPAAVAAQTSLPASPAPAIALAGRLVDAASGRPLAGALVWSDPAQPWAHAAADGSFQLTGGGTALQAAAPGYRIARIPVPKSAAGAQPRIVRLEPAAAVRGAAVDASGRPVADALIEVGVVASPAGERPVPRDRSPSETVTAPDGSFVLPGLATGLRLELRAQRERQRPASAAGSAKATTGRLSLPPLAPHEERAGLRLLLPALPPEPRRAPPAALAGEVREESGRAIEGAEVELHGAGARESAEHPAAKSGADGSFRIAGLGRGERVEIEVRHPGYARALVPDVEIGAPAPLVLVLRPRHRVAGRVVDPQGEGIRGALVLLQILPTRVDGGGGEAPLPGNDRQVETDEAGAFAADDLPPGRLSLRASAHGFQEGRLRDLTLAAGESLPEITLRLSPAGSVEGTVLDAEGHGVAGARITVAAAAGDGSQPGAVANGTSDETGAFHLEGLPPGPARLAAEHPDYRRAERPIQLQPGANRVRVTLEEGLSIAGRVADERGAAVAGATVRATGGEGQERPAVSAADGSFRISGLSAGRQRLEARAEGFSPGGGDVELEASAIEGLEIRLQRGVVLRGRLRGLAPRELADAEVGAWSPSLGSRSGSVDPTGGFQIGGVEPGEWRVLALAAHGRRQASASVSVAPGAEVPLDLDFGQGVTIAGRVLGGGVPLPNVEVSLVAVDGSTGGATQTDGQGAFAFTGLAPGLYDLTLPSPGGGPPTKRRVEAEADVQVDLEVSSRAQKPAAQ
jgi:protocatechuate 3,4-dioxygenase beta subunit